jgi:hypothetical protein
MAFIETVPLGPPEIPSWVHGVRVTGFPSDSVSVVVIMGCLERGGIILPSVQDDGEGRPSKAFGRGLLSPTIAVWRSFHSAANAVAQLKS